MELSAKVGENTLCVRKDPVWSLEDPNLQPTIRIHGGIRMSGLRSVHNRVAVPVIHVSVSLPNRVRVETPDYDSQRSRPPDQADAHYKQKTTVD